MPGPAVAATQGQTVALLLAAAGVALLWLALARIGRSAPTTKAGPLQSAIVGGLLLMAGLALLLVRRLDPVALSRALTPLAAYLNRSRCDRAGERS